MFSKYVVNIKAFLVKYFCVKRSILIVGFIHTKECQAELERKSRASTLEHSRHGEMCQVSCVISGSTNSRCILIYIYIIRLSANVFYSHFAPAIILVQLWLQKYFYWLPERDGLVRRNFEIWGAKQLKSMFAYARKTRKMPTFMTPDNAEQLRKYWESPDFKKLSEQNKKNQNSDQGGLGPSLHTCGSIPVTGWRRRYVSAL